MEGNPTPEAIRAEILRLAGERGADRSICPSEVARALAPDAWRPLMHRVRREAAALATEGQMEILRKGKSIAPEAMHGLIRLRIAR